jgi:hypothetical protein
MPEVWFHPLRLYDSNVYEFLILPKQDTSPVHFIILISPGEEWKFRSPSPRTSISLLPSLTITYQVSQPYETGKDTVL